MSPHCRLAAAMRDYAECFLVLYEILVRHLLDMVYGTRSQQSAKNVDESTCRSLPELAAEEETRALKAERNLVLRSAKLGIPEDRVLYIWFKIGNLLPL